MQKYHLLTATILLRAIEDYNTNYYIKISPHVHLEFKFDSLIADNSYLVTYSKVSDIYHLVPHSVIQIVCYRQKVMHRRQARITQRLSST